MAEGINLQEKKKIVAKGTWDDSKGTVLLQRVIKSEPHRENRPTIDPPIPASKTATVRRNQHKAKQNLTACFQRVNLPHVLMPGHIRKSILSSTPISFGLCFILLDVRFERRVFTDEAGVKQDDVRAQDGLDHSQDLRVFGQVAYPWVLKVNIVEAVLGVRFTWKHANI